MFDVLKDRLKAKITQALSVPVAKALTEAFADEAAAPEAWDDVPEMPLDFDPRWAEGLYVTEPAPGFDSEARRWALSELFEQGYKIALLDKDKTQGGIPLVPIEDEDAWFAAQQLHDRGTGVYWAFLEDPDDPGFFVYP